jgi:hypothetical protein
MRSRSALDWAGIALGAAAQAVWLGLLGAALSAASWPALAGFSAAVMVAAAAPARWAVRADRRVRRGRAALAAVVLVATAALLVAGRGWEHEYLAWQIVRDVAFCAGVALLGVWLGRGDLSPDEAFGWAVRAFAAVCAVLALCALTATPVPAPAAAVAAVVVAGGLQVVVLRYRALTEVVAENDRLSARSWLLAVAAALAAVLALTGLFAELIGIASIHALVSDAGTVLGWVAGGLAWVVAGVMRALAWLGGLLHLSVPHLELHKVPPDGGKALPAVTKTPATGSQTGRTVATVAATVAAIAVAVGVVVFALRRLTREPPRDDAVVEERETVRSVTSATGKALGGVGRRLRSLLRGRRKAQTPAEVIRLRYERLEARLTRAGSPRAAGTTVRAYLGSVLTTGDQRPADELATLYELARYSSSVVDEAQSRRFGDLAGSWPAAAGPASGP